MKLIRLFCFLLAINLMISILTIQAARGNALRDRRMAELQSHFASIYAQRDFVIYGHHHSAFGINGLYGGATPVFRALVAKAGLEWKRILPSYLVVSPNWYHPGCYEAAHYTTLTPIDRAFDANYALAWQMIESGFAQYQKLEETADLPGKIKNRSIHIQNLGIFEILAPTLTAMDKTVNEAIQQEEKLQASHKEFVINLSAILGGAKNAEEFLAQLKILLSATQDQEERAILANIHLFANQLLNSQNQIQSLTKDKANFFGNGPDSLQNQLKSIKTNLGLIQSKVDGAQADTSSFIRQLDGEIATIQKQMAEAEATVDAGKGSMDSYMARVSDVATANFQKIHAAISSTIANNFNNVYVYIHKERFSAGYDANRDGAIPWWIDPFCIGSEYK